MAASDSSATRSPIVFVVPGQRSDGGAARGGVAAPAAAGSQGAAPPQSSALPFGTLKAAVRVGAQRGGGESQRLEAVPGEDVVVLRLANGPALVLHPESARDLLLAQSGVTDQSPPPAGGSGGAPAEVSLPGPLRWKGFDQAAAVRGATRSAFGDVLLSAIEIVTGIGAAPVAEGIADDIVQHVDGQVDPGVYQLTAGAPIPPLKGSGAKRDPVAAAADGGPVLVFVHGTFVDTASTFNKLWTLHPEQVRQLFDAYANRVYALDHPTLGASPITNALTLANALPPGARLHLVTHSRGGLVGEVLARVCGAASVDEAIKGFDAPAGTNDAKDLESLAKRVAANRITVERFVRVACPSRGTLLASRRLDAYLSVLRWSLELAGVPLLPGLLNLLAQVALRRTDPKEIPGLAAMMPSSAIVRWLNGAEKPISGQLRVIAGDLQGDSIGSWVKTLLADAYYWTDNDIVVQTRSMYGGAPRLGGSAAFVLDAGGAVTHFNYFANQRTVDALMAGLTQDQPQAFRAIGPLSWAGTDSSGVRGAAPTDTTPARQRPAVFVLPGILGSNLKLGGDRIWLALRIVGGLTKLGYQANGADGVEPDGPIDAVYGALITHLAATHEVIPFGYDWRRPLEEEARRLGKAVADALDARNASGQPVRLLAHSMGGLLARTMASECPDVWQRLISRSGGRLVMLGTPNAGSWAPMQVLSADDSFGNALVAFGALFEDQAARQMMAQMPGFIQLQADLLDPSRSLAKAATWQKLADDDYKLVEAASWWHRNNSGDGDGQPQLNPYRWGVPAQTVLDQATAWRSRLDKQRATDLPQWADKLLLVVGQAPFTPDGIEMGDQGLVYLNAADGGDGRVARHAAMLPGVRTWSVGCTHGDLPAVAENFAAYEELLVSGSTAALTRVDIVPAAAAAGTARGASRPADVAAAAAPPPAQPEPARVRSRPSRGVAFGAAGGTTAVPPDTARSVFRSGDAAAAGVAPSGSGTAAPDAALRLTVQNGNLSFVRQPLLLGHYRSLALTGTEAVVDGLLGGAMRRSLALGLYPNAAGLAQVFVNGKPPDDNPWLLPRPEAAIVVGLGEEGKLESDTIAQSVAQGVIAWVQRVGEREGGAPSTLKLAATLIGSGGTGVAPGAAARAVAQGVRDANQRLGSAQAPIVSHLVLIELYLERATDAWRGLQVLAASAPSRYALDAAIEPGIGTLRRSLDADYRGADYDFISAVKDTSTNGTDVVAYTLDTRRARTEVRAQSAQFTLISELVKTASKNTNRDPQIGRTLFQLLVPVEVEPFLSGTSKMLIELDRETARVPWEMLDTPRDARAGGDARPWAIRSQLLRKLRTASFREQASDAGTEDQVLVIGAPLCDAKVYPPLPGALAEAQAVANTFIAVGGIDPSRVQALVFGDADARTVINALLAQRYRIVHISGHGELATDGKDGKPSTPGGVVLSGGCFLGPSEIQSMRVVPELVFLNCCHLAHLSDRASETPRDFDRSAFAASTAEALIGIGVRCVVAAGWAVDDRAAQTFATQFYDALLNGRSFIEAVAAAREAAWDDGNNGNTWAAYQCYGDPAWRFRRDGADAQAARPPLVDEYAGIATAFALVTALETATVETRFRPNSSVSQLERIKHLEARFGTRWGGLGNVAEAFGAAYMEARSDDDAVRCYEKAIAANDGSASLRASEQLANVLARGAWTRMRNTKTPTPQDEEAARAAIARALAMLEALLTLHPSAERMSLFASTQKRLAMIEAKAGRVPQQREAIARVIEYSQKAFDQASSSNSNYLFYPGQNLLAAELARAALDGESLAQAWAANEIATLRQKVQQNLESRAQHDPDFWSLCARVDLECADALATGALTRKVDSLLASYADLKRRVNSPWMWRSVIDQADFLLPLVIDAAPGSADAIAAKRLLEGLRPYGETTKT